MKKKKRKRKKDRWIRRLPSPFENLDTNQIVYLPFSFFYLSSSLFFSFLHLHSQTEYVRGWCPTVASKFDAAKTENKKEEKEEVKEVEQVEQEQEEKNNVGGGETRSRDCSFRKKMPRQHGFSLVFLEMLMPDYEAPRYHFRREDNRKNFLMSSLTFSS